MISDALMMAAAWLLVRIITAITQAQKTTLGVAATFA
jgi:hypothetical protein